MLNEATAIRGFFPVDPIKAKLPGIPENLVMPRRSTAFSAGYDIYNNTGEAIVIEAHTTSQPINTYIKAKMPGDNFLAIVPRSGHGFKYSVRLANTVGIIDSDFYSSAKADGHIMLKLRNPSDTKLVIPVGEAMAQGIFHQYLITDDDEDTRGGERVGGIGSTTAQ